MTISNPIETHEVTDNDGYRKTSYGSPAPVIYDNLQRKTHIDLITRVFVAEASAGVPAVDHSDVQGNPIFGGCGVDVTYSAYIYTKNVFLSRQGAHGDVPDADGNLHGDTIFSRRSTYYDYENGHTIEFEGLNWQQFYAGLAGSWYIPETTAVWQPAYSGATLTWNQWSMVYGGTYIDDGKVKGVPVNPVSGTMSYSAVDHGVETEGGASAKYFLKVHEPFKIKGDVTTTTVLENVHPVSGYYTGSRNVDGQGNDQAILTVDYSSQWTVGISLGGSLEAANCASLELGFDVSHTWSYTVTTGAQFPLPVGWRARLMAGHYVKVHTGTSEAYDSGGPLGDVDWETRVPDGSTTFHSDPEYVGDPNGGGGGLGGGNQG